MSAVTGFKAYDIRGRLGIDRDDEIAYRIGRAFALALGAKTVVLGRDVRASSEALAASVARGLVDEGCRVLEALLQQSQYAAKSQAGLSCTAPGDLPHNSERDRSHRRLHRAGVCQAVR